MVVYLWRPGNKYDTVKVRDVSTCWWAGEPLTGVDDVPAFIASMLRREGYTPSKIRKVDLERSYVEFQNIRG